MDTQSEVISILQSTLGLPDGAIPADPATPVLGAIPEMDSMSVVSILTALEEQYGIMVDDDEIDADVFATVGSLTAFLESKLG
ncbi:MAG: hypothetical protein KDI09_13475 [Halioglobus sp.]|nr:hypothetical protein [Halioglobus sp.]